MNMKACDFSPFPNVSTHLSVSMEYHNLKEIHNYSIKAIEIEKARRLNFIYKIPKWLDPSAFSS